MKQRTHLVPVLRAGLDEEKPLDEYMVEAWAALFWPLVDFPFDWFSRWTSILIR